MSKHANAKINLFLHVIGKRDDGYHLLESMAVFAKDIHDELVISSTNQEFYIEKSGDFTAMLPEDDQLNILYKTLNLFYQLYPTQNKINKIELVKNIPVFAGIGGGSSDAAALFKLLGNYHNIKINNPYETSAKIGADVPICFYNQPCYFKGIGEDIIPITKLPPLYLVLTNPLKPISTKDAFSKLQSTKWAKPLSQFSTEFHSFTQLIDFLKTTDNVMESIAYDLIPEVKTIIDAIRQQPGCHLARMSGTGATCFGIFESQEAAKTATSELAYAFKGYWVRNTSF